jgi:sugar/nucleoside kinase (ribokinase family)
MNLLVVGSVAIDSIQTPWGQVQEVLGGSATYASLAASLWTKAAVVAVVGEDFPKRALALFDNQKIDRQGLVQLPGRTFRWKGRYGPDGNALTLHLDLGVFRHFQPKLTPPLRRMRNAFLGNIQPSLQGAVLDQLENPDVTACDSRDHWIEHERRAFLKVLKRVDLVFLNDVEARLLTGESNLVLATKGLVSLGPRVGIVKKGEHGVLAASKEKFVSLPAYPVARVVDPTGAGDAFAGACLGILVNQKKRDWKALCAALQAASVTASITIGAFGPTRLLQTSRAQIMKRARAFQSLSTAVIL